MFRSEENYLLKYLHILLLFRKYSVAMVPTKESCSCGSWLRDRYSALLAVDAVAGANSTSFAKFEPNPENFQELQSLLCLRENLFAGNSVDRTPVVAVEQQLALYRGHLQQLASLVP